MWEGLESLIVISGAIENEIPGFGVFFLQPFIRKQVKLVGLVPFAESITELLP